VAKPRRKLSSRLIRTLSGLVIGLGFCGPAVFYGTWPFTMMTVAVIAVAVLEYERILQSILSPPLAPILRYAHLTVSIGTILAAQLGVLTGIFECAAVALLVMLLVVQGNTKNPEGGAPISFGHISSQVFGVFYTGYLPAFWVRLRMISVPLASLNAVPTPFLQTCCSILHWPLNPTVGVFATSATAVCIIMSDTCAYLGGKRWGKTPLILVSPGKTREGMYCGMAGAVGTALFCNFAWGSPAHPAVATGIGFMIFCASLLGDLSVSAMKRDAGLKDAGSLIPGHGGILDRFDSYFFSAPTAYFCWYMYLKACGISWTPLLRS